MKKHEILLHRIESLGDIGHWEVDLITGENTWSDHLFRILGLDPQTTTPCYRLAIAAIHPEDRANAVEIFQRFRKTGDSFKTDSRIVRPSGEIRYLTSEGVLDRGSDGRPLRMFGISKDISEERQKEAKLQKSNLQLENILNTTQDLIFLTDENGFFLKVSRSCEKILGYSRLELIGKSYRDLVHPDDFDLTVESRKRIMEGYPSSDFQNRYFKKDGSVVHLNWSATLDRSSNTVFAVARDITQLAQTKEALKTDRQKLAIVLDASPETIWALDRNYNLITANTQFIKSMKKAFNWDVSTGDNLVFNIPLPADFILEWKLWYDRAFTGETFSVVRKMTMMKKGGYIEINFKPIFEDGNLIAIGCYSMDITQRKEEELQIRELVNRLNLAQKIGKLGYWEFDIQTEVIYWSDEVYEIWQIDRSRFNPNFELFFNTIHPDDRASFLIHHNKTLLGTVPLDAVHRIVLPSGQIKFVHEKGGLETDPETGVKRFRGTVQDITQEKLIEKELLARNEFIESTLRNLPLGIAVNKISTGETTYINPAFCQIYGWPAEVFKDVEIFFSKIYPNNEYREFITKQVLDDIQSGDPNRMIWKNIPISTESGEERIIFAKNIPLPEQDLMISTVIDETDRYWAEHSLRTSNDRFHLATQAVSDAIWDWDIKKNSIFWGKGYHRLFGYPEEMEQVTEAFWQSKIHPEDVRGIWESLLEAKNNRDTRRWTGEYRFLKSDGSFAFVIENTVILRDFDGNPVRMVGAIRDITHRRMFEESLKKLNAELAESNRELEISNKELEQFAYVASHDLQEPLRMISSFLGLIKLKYSHILDEKGQQYIHYSIDGAKRMREIILDLLEFSRVGNHTESKKLTKTEELVKEVLLLNKKTIQDNDATVHIGKLPQIICHASSIIHLFQNLLANGLKYQQKGNKPEIWIEGEEFDGEWQFSVRDNGIGIDSEFSQKIFVIFQRLHHKDQYSGSGIGLAICKKIVEFHGGKIWVESSPGKGSTFFFTIMK